MVEIFIGMLDPENKTDHSKIYSWKVYAENGNFEEQTEENKAKRGYAIQYCETHGWQCYHGIICQKCKEANKNYTCKKCGEKISSPGATCLSCGYNPHEDFDIRCKQCGERISSPGAICSNCGYNPSKYFNYTCQKCGERIVNPGAICPNCGYNHSKDFNYTCQKCGEKISNPGATCLSCGYNPSKDFNYTCQKCGERIISPVAICQKCGYNPSKDFNYTCQKCGERISSNLSTCQNCGYNPHEDYDVRCKKCGEIIQSNLSTCQKCGYNPHEDFNYTCQKCGERISSNLSTCQNCGYNAFQSIQFYCKNCGQPLISSTSTCKHCGYHATYNKEPEKNWKQITYKDQRVTNNYCPLCGHAVAKRNGYCLNCARKWLVGLNKFIESGESISEMEKELIGLGFYESMVPQNHDGKADKQELDDYLACQGLTWFVYIKMFKGYPWIVGKSGTKGSIYDNGQPKKRINDIDFYIGTYQEAEQLKLTGQGREFIRDNFPGDLWSDSKYILVKPFQTEHEALDEEALIRNMFKLFSS